jgi:hypothetical protein
MTYAGKLAELSRTPCQLGIITLDFCSLTYGVGACTAAGAAGTECYNTFPTCQAKSAYVRSTKDYKFTSHEAPLPFKTGERPYIKSISYLPTEIKDSLTVKGRVTLEMVDEPDTDIGIDPYVATRASVQGTYWKKWLSRNPNYKGRPLKLYDGFDGLTEADFISDGKMFTGIIDNITLGKGIVKIEAVDILKALDDIEIPLKLNIKLASDISINQTSITLVSEDMASMDTPTGYILIDDEIIYYGAINTTTKIISSCTRAQLGTVAAVHSSGANVQMVKYYAEDNPFDTMEQILTDAGIPAGDVESTTFATEKAFVDDMNVMTVLTEPTKASILYYELVDLMNCKTWVSESLQITIARNLPNRPTRAYTALTDDEDILENSCEVDLNQKSLLTRCSIYWDKSILGKEDETASYGQLTVVLDADAEGVDEQNTVAEKKIMSRWINNLVTGTEEALSGWVVALAARQVWQLREAQPILSLDVEIKNSGLLTGQYTHISTDELQEVDGSDLDARVFQIVKRERKDNKINLKCLRLTPKRICYFTPGTGSPVWEDGVAWEAGVAWETGPPDYASATDAEKEMFGYFCGADGNMADLTPGYVFF